MKTIAQWFKEYPDPGVRAKLLANLNPDVADRETGNFPDALDEGFDWPYTPEGGAYWDILWADAWTAEVEKAEVEEGEPSDMDYSYAREHVRLLKAGLAEAKRLLRVAIDDIKFLMDPRAGISAFNEKEFRNNVRRAEKFLDPDAGSEDPRA